MYVSAAVLGARAQLKSVWKTAKTNRHLSLRSPRVTTVTSFYTSHTFTVCRKRFKSINIRYLQLLLYRVYTGDLHLAIFPETINIIKFLFMTHRENITRSIRVSTNFLCFCEKFKIIIFILFSRKSTITVLWTLFSLKALLHVFIYVFFINKLDDFHHFFSENIIKNKIKSRNAQKTNSVKCLS